MHYKTNRLNHDFQIAHFIAGSCQTPDAAYAILCDLKEDRSNALKSFAAYNLRDRAKIKRAERVIAKFIDPETQEVIDGDTENPDYLDAKADIVELQALAETTQRNYDAAVAELETIQKCMDALQAHRRFAHLPDAQAHEAAQHEEWKLQLIHTAENHLLTGHAVPPDHYATMRMHPEFLTAILPSIEKTQRLIHTSGSSPEAGKLLADHLGKKRFDLPKMLGAPDDADEVKQLK